MLRRLFKLVLIAAILAASIAGWLWYDMQTSLQQALNITPQTARLEVRQGSSLREVAKDLHERGVLRFPRYLLWAARQQGRASQIKAGEYEIKPGTTPLALLDMLVAGKVTEYSLTLVEGWTFGQLLGAIDADRRLKHELTCLHNEAVMEAVGLPGQHPEGRFFPATYRFARGATDTEILKRAFVKMGEVLDKEWEGRDLGVPLKQPYEALILASIVEKETGAARERPEIAGVFTRRLQKGMRLETDPTIIYGLGLAYDGNLRKRDLQAPGPYNTYINQGLTPTPIAAPGQAAIHAALHPSPGNALFFVSRNDGSHEFSETLDDHNRAVTRFQKRQKMARHD